MTNPPKRRDAPLTRDEILTAALRLIDEGGVAALTMRRVAESVGVEAMSLYHHVPNKDALLDGVIELVLREMSVPKPMPENWMDLMEAMLSEFRRVLVEHPNVLPLVANRPPATPTASPYMRVPLEVLAKAGLPATDVVALYQSLLAFTFGHSLLSVHSIDARKPSEEAVGELAEMLEEWDAATFRRSVRALMKDYAPE